MSLKLELPIGIMLKKPDKSQILVALRRFPSVNKK
jgi:hypothetical protein